MSLVIRKGFGDTKIIVPLDVGNSAANQYFTGSLNFLWSSVPASCAMKTISLDDTPDYKRANKTVKIVPVFRKWRLSKWRNQIIFFILPLYFLCLIYHLPLYFQYLLDFTWQELFFNDLELLQSIFCCIIGLSLTILIVIAAVWYNICRQPMCNLRRLLDGRRLEPTDQPELDRSASAWEEMHRLTENSRSLKTKPLQTEGKTPKQNDGGLRVTVMILSQGIFAANMILGQRLEM